MPGVPDLPNLDLQNKLRAMERELRELAVRQGVSTGTVASAYASAEEKSLKGENKVPIDTAIKDPSGLFGANAFYTAPAEGYYQVNGTAGLKCASETIQITRIHVSGTNKLEGQRVVTKAGQYGICVVTGILFLAVGAKVELYTYVETGEAEKLSQTGSCDVMSVVRVA